MTRTRVAAAASVLAAIALCVGGCQNPPTSPSSNETSPPAAELTTNEPIAEVAVRDGPTARAFAEIELPTGRRCRVHFRRDAVGVAGTSPLGLTEQTRPKQLAQIEGTVDHVSDEWLVVTAAEGRTFWIPRSMVLAVEFAGGGR